MTLLSAPEIKNNKENDDEIVLDSEDLDGFSGGEQRLGNLRYCGKCKQFTSMAYTSDGKHVCGQCYREY